MKIKSTMLAITGQTNLPTFAEEALQILGYLKYQWRLKIPRLGQIVQSKQDFPK